MYQEQFVSWFLCEYGTNRLLLLRDAPPVSRAHPKLVSNSRNSRSLGWPIAAGSLFPSLAGFSLRGRYLAERTSNHILLLGRHGEEANVTLFLVSFRVLLREPPSHQYNHLLTAALGVFRICPQTQTRLSLKRGKTTNECCCQEGKANFWGASFAWGTLEGGRAVALLSQPCP